MPGELGLVGGVIGGIGGAIEAQKRASDIRETRRDVVRGTNMATMTTARQVAGVLGSAEYLTGANFLRSMFGIQGNAADDIQNQLTGAFGSTLLKGTAGKLGLSGGAKNQLPESANEYLASVLPGVKSRLPSYNAMDPLSADFVKNLRVAQAQRGLESSAAGGAAEASGLASFRAQLQMQLLPQLMSLAENPLSLRNRYEGGNLQRDVFATTRGAVAYGQANPGLMSEGSVVGGALQGVASGLALGGSLEGGGIDKLIAGLFAPKKPTTPAPTDTSLMPVGSYLPDNYSKGTAYSYF